MTFSFNEISSTTRTPFVHVEIDASRAVQGPQLIPGKTLLVGQRRSAGTIAALTPVRVQNKDQAAQYFGAGSQLASIADAYFANDAQTEVWAIGIADPSGASATGTVVFGGTPTEAGTAVIYVAGRRYAIPVAAAALTTALATALANAVTADTACQATGAPTASTVTLTARHVGVMGNDIDVRHSHADDEGLPAGLTVTITPMAGGTGDPVLSAIWTPLGDIWFTTMVIPMSDATNLTALETELASRFSASRHIGAQAYTGKAGSLSTVQTLGNTRNAPRSSIVGTNLSPTSPWDVAAMVAGQYAKSVSNDPARPFQTLPLVGMLAPLHKDRWTQAERNTHLFSGISTFTVGPDGTCLIERLISTYKTNAAGGADPAWLDANTGATVDQLRYDFINLISTRYPRHKLADDGGNHDAGQLIVTPSLMRAELIGLFRAWEGKGWVEGFEQFKRDLIVERNTSDPSRLDVLLPPDLVNGLRVVATRLQFIL